MAAVSDMPVVRATPACMRGVHGRCAWRVLAAGSRVQGAEHGIRQLNQRGCTQRVGMRGRTRATRPAACMGPCTAQHSMHSAAQRAWMRSC